MATKNFDQCISWLLDIQNEGGYVDNKKDPGGKTNHGVTAAVWRDWKRLPTMPTEAQMRALTNADVTPLYRLRYWGAVNADNLPSGVDYAVFDYAVNSGPAKAATTLQALVGVTADGKIGPATLAAVAAFSSPAKLIELYCSARLGYLKALPGWETFGDGWDARVKRVEQRALALCGDAPQD